MKAEAKEKIIVLGIGLVVFTMGIAALSMERGSLRTVVLTLCFAGLLALAARQTIKRLTQK